MRRLVSMMALLVALSASAALTFDLQTIAGGVRITPSDDKATYMWQLVNEESLAGMAKYVGKSSLTVEEYWQAYIDLQWFIPAWDLNTGELDLIYTEMYAIEEGPHTLVVAGCDEEGGRTSDFAKLDVIISMTDNDIVFDVRVTDITKTTARISVTPSDNDASYYFDYVEAAAVAQYATEDDFARDYVDFLRSYSGNALGNMLSKGADSYLFTDEDGIASGTSYYAFAVAINMTDTTYRPAIKMVPFQTIAQNYIEDFTFSFSYDETTNKVSITPSYMDEKYVWQIYPEWEVNQKYGGSPERAWVENAPVAAKYAATGIQTVNLTWECMWEGLYYLTVAGYNKGQTSAITVYEIEIDEEGNFITKVPSIEQDYAPRKVLHDGQLLIDRAGTMYDVLGR